MGFIQPEAKGPETINKATINLLSAVPTLLETQKLLDAYSYHVLVSLLCPENGGVPDRDDR
jgi:hypothetical protein